MSSDPSTWRTWDEIIRDDLTLCTRGTKPMTDAPRLTPARLETLREFALERPESLDRSQLAELFAHIDALTAALNRTKEMTMPDLIDPIIEVQETLDEWLEDNPEAQAYVTKIYYLPEGAAVPDDVTHINRLMSVRHLHLELRLGVVATAETAALSNVILGILERAANHADPKPGA